MQLGFSIVTADWVGERVGGDLNGGWNTIRVNGFEKKKCLKITVALFIEG